MVKRKAAAFRIVGVGASAGGLDAFGQLLEAMPPRPNVCIVFVQHLAPHHICALPSLLTARSKMPVTEAVDGVRLEPSHVYVVPPNAQMELQDGHLHLGPRPDDRTQHRPVDFFFRSLARTLQSRAIGVVLSGTASDGALGVREIKAKGGIAIVQDPLTAKYDGMLRSAIATQMIDFALSPPDIARMLVQIADVPPHEARPGKRRDERRIIGAQSHARIALNGTNHIVMERGARPSVLVDQSFQVVQFNGQTGLYLEPSPDEPSFHVLKLAREGLLHALRTALQSARKTRKAVRRPGLRVRSGTEWHEVDIEVTPIVQQSQTFYLVLFEKTKRTAKKTAAGRPVPGSRTATGRIARLEEELAATREYLQSTIQEIGAANEELQSANEAIVSSNEALQSTNEELDTAKEALQRTNEELNR